VIHVAFSERDSGNPVLIFISRVCRLDHFGAVKRICEPALKPGSYLENDVPCLLFYADACINLEDPEGLRRLVFVLACFGC